MDLGTQKDLNSQAISWTPSWMVWRLKARGSFFVNFIVYWTLKIALMLSPIYSPRVTSVSGFSSSYTI